MPWQIYGKLASYLWKETQCAIFPGERVDCRDKKKKTKSFLCFAVFFVFFSWIAGERVFSLDCVFSGNQGSDIIHR